MGGKKEIYPEPFICHLSTLIKIQYTVPVLFDRGYSACWTIRPKSKCREISRYLAQLNAKPVFAAALQMSAIFGQQLYFSYFSGPPIFIYRLPTMISYIYLLSCRPWGCMDNDSCLITHSTDWRILLPLFHMSSLLFLDIFSLVSPASLFQLLRFPVF